MWIFFQKQFLLYTGKFNYADLGFFLLVGVVGGIIGIMFNTINMRILRWRKAHVTDKWRKIAEAMAISLITSILILGIPLFFSCQSGSVIENTCSDYNSEDSRCRSLVTFGRFTCPEGHYNPAESIISGLFHRNSEHWFPLGEVFLFLIVYYAMVLLACGIAVPAGLFIPLILIGAALGHGMGQAYNKVFGLSLDIGVYALLGSAGVLGGVTRMTMSVCLSPIVHLCVCVRTSHIHVTRQYMFPTSLTAILLEITNDIYYLMPIMIVVMVSKWIGDRFNSALYDSHVALKNMPYLEAKLPSWVPTYIAAHDIMNPSVISLPAICSLRVLLQVINDRSHQHSAFAVLEGPAVQPKELMKMNNKYTQRSGTFAGMVLRWHILILLYNKHYGTPEKLLKFTRKNILTQAQMTDRTWKQKMHVTLEELSVKEYELDMMYIDLSPYIYLSPITVSPHTPINIVYNIFRGLAMRHLVCLDENEKIAGVITCHELIESNLEEVVKRIHQLFDLSGDSNEMFEQRLRFLKNYDTFLLSSGNKWLNDVDHSFDNRIRHLSQDQNPPAEKVKTIKNDEYTLLPDAEEFD
ncbi:channel voltage activated chloride channel [Reticulomyxa filosa]|uniref:Chloride channel protein n=1 Tax=Reticulomyxa filosa TaxID=46433 RepID=X6NC30_RETFI|nr:channel voltage activated chloride channel [Reticulomyxa filosa]|eukprot:ETO23581.1 channel voltage activated chloride channel [Reticulomyxa filosa]